MNHKQKWAVYGILFLILLIFGLGNLPTGQQAVFGFQVPSVIPTPTNTERYVAPDTETSAPTLTLAPTATSTFHLIATATASPRFVETPTDFRRFQETDTSTIAPTVPTSPPQPAQITDTPPAEQPTPTETQILLATPTTTKRFWQPPKPAARTPTPTPTSTPEPVLTNTAVQEMATVEPTVENIPAPTLETASSTPTPVEITLPAAPPTVVAGESTGAGQTTGSGLSDLTVLQIAGIIALAILNAVMLVILFRNWNKRIRRDG